MSKSPSNESQVLQPKAGGIDQLNLKVEIVSREIKLEDLQEFVEATKDKSPRPSLVEYIKEKHYKDQNVVVVPVLSKADNFIKLNLDGVDFSGVKMTGVTFEYCELNNAIFCDADLSGVDFIDCNMSGADMRGADLSFCRIGSHGEKWIAYTKGVDEARKNNKPLPPVPEEWAKNYQNMRFSSTADLMYLYGETNKSILLDEEKAFPKKKEAALAAQDAKIKEKNDKIAEVNKKRSNFLVRWAGRGEKSVNAEYDKLVQERDKLVEERATIAAKGFYSGDVKYIVDPSLIYIPKTDASFDPGYVRGSSKKEREQEKQYVKLDKADFEAYLAEIKTKPELTLNDFAKSKAPEKGVELHERSKVVAYAKFGTDLSKLDFTGANLQEACFVGAKLRGCNFTNANLSRSIFESADIRGANFQNAKAEDANFFRAFLDRSTIVDSSFKRAFMRGVNAPGVQIDRSNFNYSDIRDGQLNGAAIKDTTFNYANLEGVSLANADIRRTQMQHAMLDKAILNNCEIIESNFKEAFLGGVQAVKANIQKTSLEGISAKGSNLTEAEIDKLSSLKGADLEKAVMERVIAEGVNFAGACLEGANLEHAKLNDANLENANLRFADLRNAAIKEAEANGIDMTGANLTRIDARGAELQAAILKDAKGEEADFTGAVMQSADLRGANLYKAIMEDVDLRKADIRNAELRKANLKGVQANQAKANDGTCLSAANTEGASGKLEKFAPNDLKTSEEATLEKIVDESESLDDARSKGAASRALGDALNVAGDGCKRAAEVIRHPVPSKWGRRIGGVLGAIVIGGIAASAVMTGGLSLAVMAGIVAGAVAVGGVGGAIAGHYGAPHIKLSTAAATFFGLVAGGGIGAAVGFGVGIGANRVVDVDERVADGVEGLGQVCKDGGKYFGVTEKQKEQEKRAEQCIEDYIPDVGEEKPTHIFNKEAYEKAVAAALSRQKEGVYITPESVQTPAQEPAQNLQGREAASLPDQGVYSTPETPAKPKEQTTVQEAAQGVGERLKDGLNQRESNQARRDSTSQARGDSVSQANEKGSNEKGASQNGTLSKPVSQQQRSSSQRGKS